MSDTHYLHTLEQILEVARTTGLFARGDMIPDARKLLVFAYLQLDLGDVRYHYVKHAALDALCLMEGPHRDDFDEFTNDRILMNGSLGRDALEELDEPETITDLKMR
ncbi:hypothetical protein [Rhizobium leguminosarum]|uniref:hypothetical protein n=1 Tax=Rhizobium leguminosarum TaxID=384 RepID=UPI002E0D162B|nr:hypothetical protein U8Q02_41535 [Rhizobium leguminosarum]